MPPPVKGAPKLTGVLGPPAGTRVPSGPHTEYPQRGWVVLWRERVGAARDDAPAQHPGPRVEDRRLARRRPRHRLRPPEQPLRRSGRAPARPVAPTRPAI